MAPPPIDLMSGAFYGTGAREAYAWMRRNAPVYFDRANELWGVATYDLVLAASRDATTFSNAGGSRPKVGPMPWMIDMDGALHHKRRKLVSSGFTPRRVRDGEARIAAICDDLIDKALAAGECDLVRDLAAPLPLIVIGDMLGIPSEDRDDLLRWSDDLLGSLSGDPEHLAAAATAFGEFNDYARRAMDTRRAEPQDDLISILVHAEIDGERLSDDEIVMESLLLLVGGDETTRHVISGGMLQLLNEPEQLATLRADMALLPSAVEEMLRWVSPIKNMNRTVTRDIELAGERLREGDQVELLYESANFDDAHFAAPEQFDITRAPNDHVAFGFGAHFCLGASLARQEASVMVARLLQRAPALRCTAEATRSQFFNTVEVLPVQLV